MRKFGLLLCYCLHYCGGANCQVDYPIFKSPVKVLPADSNQLIFVLDNLSYLHNNEYFGKIPTTGTLFGYQLIPELKYQLNDHFLFKAGIFLQKEFGRARYTRVAPTFLAKYSMKKCSILIGNLEGSLDHGFIEPIYDQKSFIQDRLEEGLQFKVFTKPYTMDLFLNWRRAKQPTDTLQEEFDDGITSRFIFNRDKKVRFGIPVQILHSHIGGQNISPNIKQRNLVDMSVGISIDIKTGPGFLKRIVTEHHYVYYKDLSTPSNQSFPKGNGYLSHLLLDMKYFDIDLRYWNGTGFYSPRGAGLFQSVSEFIPGYTEKKREIVIMSVIYDKELANKLFIDARVSPYYDFRNKLIEYSYELYLRYSLELLLKKL